MHDKFWVDFPEWDVCKDFPFPHSTNKALKPETAFTDFRADLFLGRATPESFPVSLRGDEGDG